MDTAAFIVDGRTYAPVRYLAEYFGYVVNWDGTTRMVCIDLAYISEPGYTAHFEDGIALRIYPSTGYEEVVSIKIISGKINGVKATVKESDMRGIHGSVYEFSLWAAQPCRLETLESTLEITLKNGKVIERTYTQKYADFFPGGIVPAAV